MSQLITWLWWKAALIRAARTAAVVAVPYIGGASLFNISWLTVVSAAGFGAVGSLITSAINLPEAGANVPYWQALLERLTKTAAQALAAGFGNVLLFQDVHWSTVLQSTLIAVLGSLLLAVIAKLPETGATVPLVAATGAGTAESPAVITTVAEPAVAVTAPPAGD